MLKTENLEEENIEEMLYQENILEHYRNPKNKIERSVAEEYISKTEELGGSCICISADGDNPDCGDSGTIFLKVEKESNEAAGVGKIVEAKFSGFGCALSQSAFDMLCEDLAGKDVGEVRLYTPSNIYELLKIKVTPSRVNCALLSYRALEKVLKSV